MGSLVVVVVTVVVVVVLAAALAGTPLAVADIHDDWDIEWAPQNVQFTQDGNGVALSVASVSSSGCNLRTKEPFIYRSISSLIKLVPGDSAGIVTTLYASTVGRGQNHEEIDFEFIGNVAGQPYTFHTNLFVAGIGGKEVEFSPWFDPTTGFHNYTISWSSCMIVWYVDGIPIRVFRNYEAAAAGNHGVVVAYPTSQPMYGYISTWETSGAWATHGGVVRTDWSKAPFISEYYELVNLNVEHGGEACQRLTPTQLRQMREVQSKYKTYDYCNDSRRFNGQIPPECSLPQY